MTKPMVTIHNAETGKIETREMNAQELAQWKADQAEQLEKEEVEAAKVAEKTALLAKLGITEDEAKLLLS